MKRAIAAHGISGYHKYFDGLWVSSTTTDDNASAIGADRDVDLTLTPRDLSFLLGGMVQLYGPAQVTAAVEAYAASLGQGPIPKLAKIDSKGN